MCRHIDFLTVLGIELAFECAVWGVGLVKGHTREKAALEGKAAMHGTHSQRFLWAEGPQ